MPSSIFIVDSSPAVRRMVEQISTPEGFEVIGFQDGPAALDAARRLAPALIIADYHLNNMTFSGFCKEVNKLENLSETYVISLIDAADRPDETHLRSLGVKAFLKKPFQSDDLLDIIKSLQQKQQGQTKGAGLKRRVWPPTSTSTDAEDEDGLQDDSAHSEEQENETLELPLPSLGTPAAPGQSTQSTPTAPTNPVQPKPSEESIGQLVHQAVERAVTTQVRTMVQRELREQLDEMLSKERLATLVKSLLTQELPQLLRNEMASCEPVIRDTVSDVAGSLIKERVDQLVKEHSETGIRKHLSEAVREQLGSIDLIVTDAVRQAVVQQAPLIADDAVRTSAEQSVEKAVQRIVPELAEQHIKAELKRLTSAD